MSFVNLSKLPSPPTSRVSNIQSLAGGLNIHDIPWQLGETQSPEMKNMWWEDGALRSRPAQVTLKDTIDGTADSSDCVAYSRPYHGWYVFHRSNKLIAVSEDLQVRMEIEGRDMTGVPFGTFVLFDGVLLYKAPGVYLTIKEEDSGDYFDEGRQLKKLVAAWADAYIPTVLINADPATPGAGDLYQPMNRLNVSYKVTYNASEGAKKFFIPTFLDSVSKVEYLDETGEWITTTDAGTKHDHINQRSCLEIYDENVNIPAGTNNVRLTIYRRDDEAMKQRNDLLSCGIAEVYGGGEGLCVVLAGCESQPNAYFWSANTDVAMDPTYFPMEHYNLAGDFSDPITAFGKQQNMLVVFQERRTGAAQFSTTDIDGRTFITMDYHTINPYIGCDVPKSVQLIDNNLVFANKRLGVMLIRDTTSAGENIIVQLSRNIEKTYAEAGLLYDLHNADVDITSIDDGRRYWLCIGEHAWLWDYRMGGSINNPANLAWFYFDNIQIPATWFGQEDLQQRCFVGRDGYIRKFSDETPDTYDATEEGWTTLGEDFEKVVALPIQNFGTYEVLKNVSKAIFVVEGEGNAKIDIEYETDYEVRMDRTPIMTQGWSLVPRNLVTRSLKVYPFAVTAVRKPGCRNVRHFLIRLKNKARGEKIAFVSAQIYYTFQGVDR